MLMFAFSLVVAFRFAIINCRNDSVEAFEPRERKKGAQMCTSWRFIYFISNDARTKSRDAHRWTVYMANVLAHMKPVSYILRFVKVAHQFQCTTIDYFDSCLCNFYCWFRRRKKKKAATRLIYSTIGFGLHSFHGYLKLHFACSPVIYNTFTHFHWRFGRLPSFPVIIH